MQLYSVFERYWVRGNNWYVELNFYHGDMSNVCLDTDWRFKAIEGKRRKDRFMGTVKGITFPVTEPFRTSKGIVVFPDNYNKLI